jgi:hypothetical protein
MAKSKSKSEKGKTFVNEDGITIREIPLRKPDFGPRAPGHKTLIDIVDEKRPRNPDGTPIVAHSASDEEEVVFGPVMTTMSFLMPLSMLLGGFDVLVHQQYGQDVVMEKVIWRVARAVPGISLSL